MHSLPPLPALQMPQPFLIRYSLSPRMLSIDCHAGKLDLSRLRRATRLQTQSRIAQRTGQHRRPEESGPASLPVASLVALPVLWLRSLFPVSALLWRLAGWLQPWVVLLLEESQAAF